MSDAVMLDLLKNFDSTLRVLRWDYLYAEIKPQPKQSVRFGRGKGGKMGRAFPDKKKLAYTKELAKLLEQSWQKKAKFCGHIRLTVMYSFPWREEDKPMKTLGWILMGESPDLDNCYKPVADVLQKLCYANDSQIVEVRMRKVRADFVGIYVGIEHVMAKRLTPATSSA